VNYPRINPIFYVKFLDIENNNENVLLRYSCIHVCISQLSKNHQQARLAGYSEDSDSILGKSEYFTNS
jgi:hypothetical protein